MCYNCKNALAEMAVQSNANNELVTVTSRYTPATGQPAVF